MTHHENAYAPDPTTCDKRRSTVGVNAFCELCNQWVNCLAVGCATRADGKPAALDNSPEACAARLAAMENN